MVKVYMQFPYVKGSKLYDGEKHDCDTVDAVKIGRTNIYVLEYIDNKLNKRSRCLIQKGKERVSHIPLYDKTGLNNTFDYWKSKKQTASLEEIFRSDKDIGMTTTYDNLDAFMAKIEESKKEKPEAKKVSLAESMDRMNDAMQSAVSKAYEEPVVVKEGVFTSLANAIDNLPDAPETGPTEIDRGDLGYYSSNPVAFGPGRQSGFGRPMMYVGGMRPPMGPGMGRPPMGGPGGHGGPRGPIPPREGPVPEGPIPEGPVPEGPPGPRKR